MSMKRRTLPILFLSTALMMIGCGSTNDLQNNTEINKGSQELENADTTESIQTTDTEKANNVQIDTSEMFSKKDYKTDYKEDKVATITLNGDGATCISDAVSIEGSIVTIKDEGTYLISGNLDDGMIIVDADNSDKLHIVLDNVNIHSENSAPIYIVKADKVFMTLAEGSQNSLSNGGSFMAIDDNNIDGVLYSKQDLTINGEGSLSITSPAGHGIVCKDDLVLTGGTYQIEVAFHGMDVNDSVRVADALMTITSGKDGIHVENSDDEEKGYLYVADGSFTIEAQGDGMSASAYVLIQGGTYEIAAGDDALHADETLTVSGGKIDISTSYEGLEGLHVVVSGGDITLVASDDGINAAGGTDQSGFGGPRGNHHFGSSNSNGSIMISGGNLFITASGDGIDANGTFEMTGGHVVVCGPTTGDTATLDYDVSGVISGGTFIGTGAVQMAQSFSDSTQGVLAVKVGNQPAGTELVIKDAKGNIVLTHTPDLSYAIVIYSTPDLIKGENYTLTIGDTTGELTAN